MAKQNKGVNEYKASSIQVLTGLEPVRKRPGMYIGSTGPSGLHHLVWEVIDNAVDEAMAGFADNICIEILEDNKVRVSDNGRGIPVERHPQTKKSTLETVMTMLHAGGKFGGGGYKVSGGLHGVGVSAVNALSIWTEAKILRDGKVYTQEYKRGKPQGAVKPVGKSKDTGTIITFQPDPEVFETTTFNLDTILDYARQQAYLTKGITVKVIDRRNGLSYAFHFEGGIQSYIKHLNKNKTPVNETFYTEKEARGVTTEISLQYTGSFKENIYTYANNIHTIEGGMHLTGFRSSLTRVLNDYAKKFGFLKSGEPTIQGEDTREGLMAVVSVKLKSPQFEGQTKAKLGNPEVRTVVESVMGERFSAYLEEHPEDAKRIMEKVFLAARARIAARTARENVIKRGILEGLTLPGKLADCSEKDPERVELFIVEGDSAGGCFSGDTKVALTDGRNISFKEIIKEYKKGKNNYCYTIKNDGGVGITKIKNPRKTESNVKVIKVVLDNGEEIVCTPDHKFMLRNSDYKEVKDLKISDSLMPLYRTYSKIGGRITIEGYETICDRFFKGNEEKLKEAVLNYNHKVKKIIHLRKKIGVYDLEVKDTHNFALASGVFVHNSAKQGRDRIFQAILPLRGKILNIEKARLDKMLASNEIKALIIALGTAIGDQMDINKLRYGRIIIMTDADVDGAHIRTLLLTLFYRHFEEIISGGHLYIASPPLYKIQRGKEAHYAYTEADKNELLEEMGIDTSNSADLADLDADQADESAKVEEVEENESAESANKSASISGSRKVNVQRYKGLGEMNPEQLWETTMNPENRVLYQVTIEDAEKADEIFSVLMGGDVLPRKRFIQSHAKNVKNLDI